MTRNLILAVVLAMGTLPRSAPAMTLTEYELGWARYYARADHVPEALVDAIMIVESGGNPYAVSSKGAVGVMQLMPATAQAFDVQNRFLIEDNIRAGVAYLAMLMREFHGDLRLVVAAYYAGDGRIARQKLTCSSPAIYKYVQRVAAVYRALELSRR